MPEPDEETISQMHRWFAIECNNRAWDLAGLDERSAEKDVELMQCAVVASYHWGQVGQPIHKARADMLLAHAQAHLGEGELALQVAQRSLEFCRNNDCETWDLAFAYLEVGYSASVAGELELSRQHFELAEEEAARLSDKDRAAFDEEMTKIRPN